MKSREASPATYGFEHPEETFEFARFCLLNHYGRDERFAAELGKLADHHQETLNAVAGHMPELTSDIADYRIAWGILSFLARDPGPRKTARPLKRHIDSYQADLSELARRWGLAADWCAPSIHVALLAPRIFPGNFEDPSQVAELAPLFMWDLQRQGRPPYDALLTLPRLLLLSDAPGRQIDIQLLSHGSDGVYYDPRMNCWEDSLARVRELLGRKRISSTCKQNLLRRRREIESAFAAEGYVARCKPRRLRGQYALSRWTHWTYLAICPPRHTTAKILTIVDKRRIDTQYVDRKIKHVLDLLRLPRRPVRPS